MRIGWRQQSRAVAEVIAAFAALLITAALVGSVAAKLPDPFRTPIQALALWGAVGAGALLLRRSGGSYRALGLKRPASWWATIGWTAAGLVLAWAGTAAVGAAIHTLTNWPPLDVGYIRTSIEGNSAAWLMWMVLVVWGSAAFGEELLSRGFLLDRFWTIAGRGRAGLGVAVVLQATTFGLLHAIQGPTGIVVTAWIGLVFAGIWLASGRNLWAPILAHGISDSISLTLIYAGVPLPGYTH